MRVLAIAEFDPAGVLCGWREALRACGSDVELRVALRRCYTPQHLRADWHGPLVPWGDPPPVTLAGLDGLRTMIRESDLVVLNPGLGWPWSGDDKAGFVSPAEEFTWLPAGHDHPCAYIIHGSRATWAHRMRYAVVGQAIAATTLDYAATLHAWYIPPALFDVWGVAPERTADMPVSILQSATDPAICHTDALREWCASRGINLTLLRNHPHPVAMSHKLGATIGFDHLRGSFSVNTAEFALLGVAPVCLLRHEYRRDHDVLGDLPPTIASHERDVWAAMDRLVLDWQWHRDVQRQARRWARQLFSPLAVAARLESFFRSAA